MAPENKQEIKPDEKKHSFDANQKYGDKRKQEEAKNTSEHSKEMKNRKDAPTKL